MWTDRDGKKDESPVYLWSRGGKERETTTRPLWDARRKNYSVVVAVPPAKWHRFIVGQDAFFRPSGGRDTLTVGWQAGHMRKTEAGGAPEFVASAKDGVHTHLRAYSWDLATLHKGLESLVQVAVDYSHSHSLSGHQLSRKTFGTTSRRAGDAEKKKGGGRGCSAADKVWGRVWEASSLYDPGFERARAWWEEEGEDVFEKTREMEGVRAVYRRWYEAFTNAWVAALGLCAGEDSESVTTMLPAALRRIPPGASVWDMLRLFNHAPSTSTSRWTLSGKWSATVTAEIAAVYEPHPSEKAPPRGGGRVASTSRSEEEAKVEK